MDFGRETSELLSDAFKAAGAPHRMPWVRWEFNSLAFPFFCLACLATLAGELLWRARLAESRPLSRPGRYIRAA